MDTLSKSARSALMAKIKGKNTGPEMLVRKYLFSNGFRYRIHDRRYPGSPDIVLPKYRTAIFVHGCFWHGHENCRASRLPATNIDYWQEKIEQNIERDKRKTESLEKDGWKVIIIWECKIKNKQQRNIELEKVVERILDRI
jgi:DNA mismatch endonuclease (patch repair protein)